MLLDLREAVGDVDDRDLAGPVSQQEASHLPVPDVGSQEDAPSAGVERPEHGVVVLDAPDGAPRRLRPALGPVEVDQ
jgi:hypothetical protein